MVIKFDTELLENLTPLQALTLAYHRNNPLASQVQIAQALHTNKTTISLAVKVLRDNGMWGEEIDDTTPTTPSQLCTLVEFSKAIKTPSLTLIAYLVYLDPTKASATHLASITGLTVECTRAHLYNLIANKIINKSGNGYEINPNFIEMLNKS